MLSELDTLLIGLLTLILMVGMGASLTVDDYAHAVRRPRGVLVGLVSQFGWMPLIAHLTVEWLGLRGADAVGLMLMACASGGNASNMLTYFARADLALSISMTAISTLASVILMPALLYLYAPSSSEASLQVPYLVVAGTLALMLVPIAVGMWVRQRAPATAARVERIGAVAGAVLLVVLLVTSVSDQIELLLTAEDASLLACIFVATSGMILGYGAARLAGLLPAQRRAVSLETGVQNAPLVIAVILTSFPEHEHDGLLKLPFLYAMTALVVGTLATLVYRRFPSR